MSREAKEERERVKAAMHGVEDWGWHGSSNRHRRYVVEGDQSRHRKCSCGKRVTHLGKANGVALMSGCEWCAYRWAKGS